MCEVSQENMNVESGDEKEKTLENKWMDEKKRWRFFFWVMIATLVFLAIRPTFTIIGSGNGNGSGSGDGNNVFRSSND